MSIKDKLSQCQRHINLKKIFEGDTKEKYAYPCITSSSFSMAQKRTKEIPSCSCLSDLHTSRILIP